MIHDHYTLDRGKSCLYYSFTLQCTIGASSLSCVYTYLVFRRRSFSQFVEDGSLGVAHRHVLLQFSPRKSRQTADVGLAVRVAVQRASAQPLCRHQRLVHVYNVHLCHSYCSLLFLFRSTMISAFFSVRRLHSCAIAASYNARLANETSGYNARCDAVTLPNTSKVQEK